MKTVAGVKKERLPESCLYGFYPKWYVAVILAYHAGAKEQADAPDSASVGGGSVSFPV
jgi:hypothetical protein